MKGRRKASPHRSQPPEEYYGSGLISGIEARKDILASRKALEDLRDKLRAKYLTSPEIVEIVQSLAKSASIQAMLTFVNDLSHSNYRARQSAAKEILAKVLPDIIKQQVEGSVNIKYVSYLAEEPEEKKE